VVPVKITGCELVEHRGGAVPQVRMDDPPWDVTVGLGYRNGRPVLTRLEVRARIDSPSADVTAERLRRLPVREVIAMAASLLELDLDEAGARLLVQPKPPGQRSWPPDHYDRVLAVYEWARAAGRRGGGRGAVAEFWDVGIPTVESWLRTAREQREAAQAKPAPRAKTGRKTAAGKGAAIGTVKTPRAGRRG
jgi:hypothetical protein